MQSTPKAHIICEKLNLENDTFRKGFLRMWWSKDEFVRSANASEPGCCGLANITVVILDGDLGEQRLILQLLNNTLPNESIRVFDRDPGKEGLVGKLADCLDAN